MTDDSVPATYSAHMLPFQRRLHTPKYKAVHRKPPFRLFLQPAKDSPSARARDGLAAFLLSVYIFFCTFSKGLLLRPPPKECFYRNSLAAREARGALQRFHSFFGCVLRASGRSTRPRLLQRRGNTLHFLVASSCYMAPPPQRPSQLCDVATHV